MDQDETLLTLAAASKHVPGHPHASTLWRWCRQGIQGVQLEYRRVGRRIVTSRTAIDRFSQRVTEADRAAYASSHPTASPQPSTPKPNRDQAIAAAEAELADAGIV
jgi:hypothetical protein